MTANEQDVVVAFRQAVEEELKRAQASDVVLEEILAPGDSIEVSLAKLVERHQELEHEVALLRTIILKLISDPVDDNGDGDNN